jgi:hypothetical protein
MARGSETTTICFRLSNEVRDRLLASAYDFYTARVGVPTADVDPQDVNVSDLIRTVLGGWLDDYVDSRGGEPTLVRNLLTAQAEHSAARHAAVLQRLEAADADRSRAVTPARRTAGEARNAASMGSPGHTREHEQ